MNIIKHYIGTDSKDSDSNPRHYYIRKNGTVSDTVNPGGFERNDGYFSINREKTIGNILEDILKTAGFSNAKYFDYIDNKAVSYLCLDTTSSGFNGFYIFQWGWTTFYYGYCKYDDPTDDIIYTYYPNNSYNGYSCMHTQLFDYWYDDGKYDGYLKLVGGLNSGFEIIPCTSRRNAKFNQDDSNFCSFLIANMINKLDNSESYLYRFTCNREWDHRKTNEGYNWSCLIDKNTNIGRPGVETKLGGIPGEGFNMPYYPMGTTDNLPLIQAHIVTYPNMFFKDGYYKPNIFEDKIFYEINGDTYYIYCNLMFKC